MLQYDYKQGRMDKRGEAVGFYVPIWLGCTKDVKHWKRCFQPANGKKSTRLLVKIHNNGPSEQRTGLWDLTKDMYVIQMPPVLCISMYSFESHCSHF